MLHTHIHTHTHTHTHTHKHTHTHTYTHLTPCSTFRKRENSNRVQQLRSLIQIETSLYILHEISSQYKTEQIQIKFLFLVSKRFKNRYLWIPNWLKIEIIEYLDFTNDVLFNRRKDNCEWWSMKFSASKIFYESNKNNWIQLGGYCYLAVIGNDLLNKQKYEWGLRCSMESTKQWMLVMK